jgi:DNA mismatch repair protein MutH
MRRQAAGRSSTMSCTCLAAAASRAEQDTHVCVERVAYCWQAAISTYGCVAPKCTLTGVIVDGSWQSSKLMPPCWVPCSAAH